MTTFVKRVKKNPDWFEAGIIKLEPAIKAKCTALLNYKARAFREGISCTPEGKKQHPADCQEMR